MVLKGGTTARYSPSGHLVFARGARLLAVPFDLKRLEVTGEAMTVADGVAAEVGRGRTHFAVSRAGSLTFVSGEFNAYAREILWASRDGTLRSASAVRRGFYALSLASDGERVLVNIQGSDDDLWLLDLSRDVPTRLIFGTENYGQAWAADGRRFLWSSDREGAYNPYLSSLDDLARVERLAPGEWEQRDGGWSPDDRHIVYTEVNPTTRGDIWILPMDAGKERRPQALIKTSFDEQLPSVSPDGRWLAYISDETGRWEVYVQAFPGSGSKRQVSDGRGGDTTLAMRESIFTRRHLRWSRDGRELLYWNGDRLMSVPVRLGSELDSESPRLVFELTGVFDFDVAPDGQRFLLIRDIPRTPLTRIVVALGGASEIGRRAP